MKNSLFELIVGTAILAIAVYFFIFSFQKADLSRPNSYKIIAEFDDIGGVSNGSDVKISGVKVGIVNSQKLNNDNYRAILVLNINNDIKLPTDSSAKIMSASLLGGKFVGIEPGADEDSLSDGERIIFTQSSVNLEKLLGKFIFGSKSKEND
ncbi:outer membrane lipid asymmetry maintenance protein MlaD [Rickettsiales bacterium]|nr:outer membrane lipid asymmetry maintenance protein MlaD [Rickettsiales bacterium]